MTPRPAGRTATPPREKTAEVVESIRLNRFLAMLGVGSRRDCDDVISAGRVKVDGQKAREPGVRVIPGVTRVDLDGAPLVNLPRPHRAPSEQTRGVCVDGLRPARTADRARSLQAVSPRDKDCFPSGVSM